MPDWIWFDEKDFDLEEPQFYILARYATICERNVCAAVLLEWLVRVTPGEESERDPWISSDIPYLAFQLGSLFPHRELIAAINLLMRKGYLIVRERKPQHYLFIPQKEYIRAQDWLSDTYAEWREHLQDEEATVEPPTQKRYSEAKRVAFHNKRAEVLALPATLTLEQWLKTLNYFGWRCAYCLHGKYEVFEHFTPMFHGGGTTQTNCVPSCASCNSRKTDLHPAVFRTRLGDEVIDRVETYFRSCRRWEEEMS